MLCMHIKNIQCQREKLTHKNLLIILFITAQLWINGFRYRLQNCIHVVNLEIWPQMIIFCIIYIQYQCLTNTDSALGLRNSAVKRLWLITILYFLYTVEFFQEVHIWQEFSCWGNYYLLLKVASLWKMKTNSFTFLENVAVFCLPLAWNVQQFHSCHKQSLYKNTK